MTTFQNMLQYLIDEYTFQRLELNYPSYDAFVSWNRICLETMSEDDRTLVRLICSKMETSSLKMVDTDSTSTFNVVQFYINSEKTLCLTNSR